MADNNYASNTINTDVVSFENILSASEDNVQKALDKIDEAYFTRGVDIDDYFYLDAGTGDGLQISRDDDSRCIIMTRGQSVMMIGVNVGTGYAYIQSSSVAGGTPTQPITLWFDSSERVRITGTNIIFKDVPAADPHIAGAIWNNGGVLNISSG
jgi:hypothetical protein